MAEPVTAEQDPLIAEPHTSILPEQAKSTSAEQDTLAMLPTEDLSSTPQTSQDEGYDYGVSIDSMIVTPCVPKLGEQSPNVGTSTDVERQETLQSNNKFNFLKQAITMMISMTSSIEKDFDDMKLERASLITLVEDRLQRIQTLESLLEREKTTSAEL